MKELNVKELHKCDLCGRRIPSTSIHNCMLCNKEICQYCRISLTKTYRKYPDNGYITHIKRVGCLCDKCASKKINILDTEKVTK